MEQLLTTKTWMREIQNYTKTGIYRKGAVSYNRTTDTIIFYQDDKSDNERYHIRLARINTPEKQMLFLDHIAGKGFLTGKVLNEFFECLKLAGKMTKGEF